MTPPKFECNYIKGVRIKTSLPAVYGFRAALPTLEQEYRFWMQNRSAPVTVNGAEHVLNRYHVEAGSPRYS